MRRFPTDTFALITCAAVLILVCLVELAPRAHAADLVITEGWNPGTTKEGWHCWYFYRDKKLQAGWCPQNNVYRRYEDGRWSDPITPPWDEKPKKTNRPDPCPCCGDDCPCQSGRKPCGQSNCHCITRKPVFGVETAKVGQHGERYLFNGKEVVGNQVPNDAGKLRLTLIGPEADRERVLADLQNAPALSWWRDKFSIQDYDPDNVMVRNYGFVTTGKPTLYLQQPNGQVLLRLDAYEGPEALADALRQTDPTYDPNRDPNGKPKPAPKQPDAPLALTAPPTALIGGALVAALLLLIFKR